MSTQHELEEALLEEVQMETGQLREIVVHNDEVNTFAHVIHCLVERSAGTSRYRPSNAPGSCTTTASAP